MVSQKIYISLPSPSPLLTISNNSISYFMLFSNCYIFLFVADVHNLFIFLLKTFHLNNIFSSLLHYILKITKNTFCIKLFHNTCQELRKWLPGFLPFCRDFSLNTHTTPTKPIINSKMHGQIHRSTDGFFSCLLTPVDSAFSFTI